MIIDEIETPGWAKIVRAQDPKRGLDALVAVHDATLGPGCGGVRMHPYGSVEDALEDVKNLSRGMTYKNAIGGIPFGGGKSVIIGNPHQDKTQALFEAFGEVLNSLDGLYYTAEDAGVTEDDMISVAAITKYAAGFRRGDIGGDPSPFTARGVWRGIEAAVSARLGRDDLKGVSVCILGVGAVGMALGEHLHGAGAVLTVADIHEASLAEAKEKFGAEIISPEAAHAANVDVYAPCALGGAVNDKTFPEINAAIIAGAANNQLAEPHFDADLRARNILYAPDFVINAAGVISVGLEITGRWNQDEMERRIDAIGDRLRALFERAEREGRPTGEIADAMAEEIIAAGAQKYG
ncbi:MAG: Glu/Leu/Phe/Val dehydrogenase dimerization domain-containing protein [Pseudomonadota bacterium]